MVRGMILRNSFTIVARIARRNDTGMDKCRIKTLLRFLSRSIARIRIRILVQFEIFYYTSRGMKCRRCLLFRPTMRKAKIVIRMHNIYIYVDTYLTATVTHSERLWSETPVKSVKREKMLDWLTTVPIAHVILQRLRIIFRDGSFDIERAERKVWLLLDKLYHGLHH